ncbi:MAG: sulfatase-like hydrolase/transferase [Armatimonadetes bacterium]|nr:sulfatase-like hydrolase/transferase [Armatimonadota bacterium]
MPSLPNILWLLSDQHNPRVAGYAGDRRARTQNLDRLAAGSVRFDAAYCNSPLCVPSRLSLLMSRYPYRCDAWTNTSMLLPEHVTLAEHLSAHGYTTALVGKMHLRGPRWMGGFQHRPYGDLDCRAFCFHQPDPPETWDGRWLSHAVGRLPWAGVTEIPESLLADGVVVRESLAFLLEHADRYPARPWLLCAGFGRPHFPLTAPGRYVRRALADPPPLPPRPEGYPKSLHPHDRFLVEEFRLASFSDAEQQHALACYYASVNYLDDCIGELLRGLESAGLLRNTYVIYTSDHGDMAGEQGLWWRRSYYEASARVPLLVAGPGISPGIVRAPVELVDLFPTFCDLAGSPTPDGLDGESLVPFLGGRPETRRKAFARSELLVDRAEVALRMARLGRWKYVDFPKAPPRLFDLQADPNETRDLLRSETPASADAPIAELKELATSGVSWREIGRIRARSRRRQPPPGERGTCGPVQYHLPDGHIVDADRFLYPGLVNERGG